MKTYLFHQIHVSWVNCFSLAVASCPACLLKVTSNYQNEVFQSFTTNLKKSQQVRLTAFLQRTHSTGLEIIHLNYQFQLFVFLTCIFMVSFFLLRISLRKTVSF